MPKPPRERRAYALCAAVFALGCSTGGAGAGETDGDGGQRAASDGGGQQAPRDGGGQQAASDGGSQQAASDGGSQQAPSDGGGQQAASDGGSGTTACRRAADCDDDEACVAGACVCTDGRVRCAAACVDTAGDSLHCGDCRTVCAAGTRCAGGDCVDVDECEQQDCGPHGTCVNTEGAFTCQCDNGYGFDGVDDCAATDECAAGLLLPEYEYCPDTPAGPYCALIREDRDHCGDCNRGCGQQGVCVDYECACNPGHDYCESAGCVDLSLDVHHCGDCANDCADGATCADGLCRCPAGETDCTTSCGRLSDSEMHCGTCGRGCEVVCSAGACSTVLAVAAGASFSCALLADESVHCWGDGASGALGNGQTSGVVYTPARIAGLSDVRAIAAGQAHACAITGDVGDLYCWGENGAHQLGLADTSDQPTPLLVRSGVAKLALGGEHSCVLTTDGAVECVGSDELGQHGDGETVTASTTWSGPSSDVLADIDDLVSGESHLCALTGGEVYCWGFSAYYQGGDGASDLVHPEPRKVPLLSGVDALAAGKHHVCSLRDGDVLCWGENGRAQTGDPYYVGASSPYPWVVEDLPAAVGVYTGGQFSCARIANGELKCWGAGEGGQLGDNAVLDWTLTWVTVVGSAAFGPIALGGAHGCAVVSGDLRCWGEGSTGATTYFDDQSSPQPVQW